MDIRRLRGVAAAGVIALAALFVAPASHVAAADLVVTADRPAAVPTGHVWSFDDFFPRSLSVPTGATVTFAIQGFHTATLLPHAVSVASDLRDHGVALPDIDDIARNPNGTTRSEFRLSVLRQSPAGCGKASAPCTFDGRQVVTTGVSFGPPPGPFAVKVSAPPGRYAFHCRIHPTMNAELNVLPAGQQGTTQAELQARVDQQIAQGVRVALAIERSADHASSRVSAGRTIWRMQAGVDSADGRVAILEFLPRNLRIKRGDSVEWLVTGRSEPHSVTFPRPLRTDLIALCEQGATDKRATPRHRPPHGPTDYTCDGGPLDELEFGGGNGAHAVTSATTRVDSGVLIDGAFGGPFGLRGTDMLDRYEAIFTGPARTYRYVCQIHPGMIGRITVGS
jgi:plastocyanin